MKRFIFTLSLFIIGLAAIAAATAFLGFWPVAATAKPPSIEVRIAGSALHASLARQSSGLQNPVAVTNESLLAGMKIFQNNCAGCHGSPGRPSDWGTRNFYPRVPQFAEQSSRLTASQMFLVIKHGIRYSGMGGWQGMMSDEEMWTVATFLEHLDSLPPEVKAVWTQR